MPDMPCYPFVTKDRRTLTNDRDLLDWIREKAGDDMAELATALGYSVEEIMRGNIDKLRRRYPEGFDAGRSINRDERED